MVQNCTDIATYRLGLGANSVRIMDSWIFENFNQILGNTEIPYNKIREVFFKVSVLTVLSEGLSHYNFILWAMEALSLSGSGDW